MGKQLRNIYDKATCLKKLEQEPFLRTTISFYKYVKITDPKTLRDQLFAIWESMGVLGRIYISEEGINAQLSVPVHHEKALRASVDIIPAFTHVPFKYGVEEPHISFWKLTIKVRQHIVAHGIQESIDMTKAGRHLNAKEWHEAMDGGAIVVDMRNAYETDIGYFKDAIRPHADTFREEIPQVIDLLQDKKDKKILLYCTGGVRCESVSAYMTQKGFTDVNQLHGGIIKYAEEIKKQKLDSKFIGQNYVFDGRNAEKITPDILGTCYTCGVPCETHINCASDLCHALFLQCAVCQKNFASCCSESCKTFASLPTEERRAKRKGRKAKFLVYRAESPITKASL